MSRFVSKPCGTKPRAKDRGDVSFVFRTALRSVSMSIIDSCWSATFVIRRSSAEAPALDEPR
jgi:ribosome biogenesis protein Nip4